jgi:hypothetical protein
MEKNDTTVIARLLPEIRKIQEIKNIRTRRYPGSIRKPLTELLETGRNIERIARETGIGKSTMKNWLGKNGTRFREIIVSAAPKEKICYTIKSSSGYRLLVRDKNEAINIFRQL